MLVSQRHSTGPCIAQKFRYVHTENKSVLFMWKLRVFVDDKTKYSKVTLMTKVSTEYFFFFCAVLKSTFIVF